MTKALRVTIVGVGSALALIIFMILFAAATTFLEIKEWGERGLLVLLALSFSCWAATHVALKRWLLPLTTLPPPPPPPLPWWFRYLYHPILAPTILLIPMVALWLYWERAPWSMTAILMGVALNTSVAVVGGVLIKRWLLDRSAQTPRGLIMYFIIVSLWIATIFGSIAWTYLDKGTPEGPAFIATVLEAAKRAVTTAPRQGAPDPTIGAGAELEGAVCRGDTAQPNALSGSGPLTR